MEALRTAGVDVVAGRVQRILDGEDGRGGAVEMVGGELIPADAVVISTRFRVRTEAFTSLGLTLVEHPSGLGEVLSVDATGETSVPGLFAAGNVTEPSQQVLGAAANGARIGAMVASVLAHEDIEAATRPSANEADWDHRYAGDRVWSGNPNGALVREVGGLDPGAALDVGAGEGGDAIWLAQQGWEVTASDISLRALEHVTAEAGRQGLAIETRHADANASDAFPAEAYDLVTAQYASIPRTSDGRAVANLVRAVAPNGTLLVVSHDLAPMRSPVDTHTQSRPFDPDAYVRVADFAAVLADLPDWDVEAHATHPRPPGSASARHHVDDVVLRARRRAS